MALEKSVQTKFGVDASYHKVIQGRPGLVEVAAYFSKDARDSACSPLCIKQYPCPFSYFDEAVLKQSGVSTITQAYEFLKTLDEFSNAQDV